MSKNVDDRAVAVSVRIYERLLAAYPADFRREYGPAMEQLFRDQCRDAWSEGRGRSLAGLWLRVLADLAKTSFAEHLSSLNRRTLMLLKILRAFGPDPLTRATFVRAFGRVFVCALILGGWIAYWSPRIYLSTVRIEAQKDTREVSILHPQSAYRFDDSDPYFLTTQFKIIGSYSILTNVIAEAYRTARMKRWEEYHTQGGVAPEALAAIRDPARPSLNSVVRTKREIFLTWAVGGTLLAVVAGGAAAWFAVLTRRFSHGQGTP